MPPGMVLRKHFPELVLSDKDEAGGFNVLAMVSEQQQRETRKFAVEQNITTLRNRVNELGVAEPVIQQQGENRIVVQLPGVQDTARAKEILGATATLEFRMVDEEHNAAEAAAGHVPVGSRLYRTRKGEPVLLQKRIIITGDSITDAASRFRLARRQSQCIHHPGRQGRTGHVATPPRKMWASSWRWCLSRTRPRPATWTARR